MRKIRPDRGRGIQSHPKRLRVDWPGSAGSWRPQLRECRAESNKVRWLGGRDQSYGNGRPRPPSRRGSQTGHSRVKLEDTKHPTTRPRRIPPGPASPDRGPNPPLFLSFDGSGRRKVPRGLRPRLRRISRLRDCGSSHASIRGSRAVRFLVEFYHAARSCVVGSFKQCRSNESRGPSRPRGAIPRAGLKDLELGACMP
jgi:hypothetical protein